MLKQEVLVVFVVGALGCLSVVVHGSEKKGLGFDRKLSSCQDFAALTNISWWYDWWFTPFYISDPGHNSCALLAGVTSKYVPMVYGWYYDHDPLNFPFHANTQALLGFNDPNHKDQSAITPEAAALHWPKLEQLAAGIPLVSPAVSSCNNSANCYGDTVEWFDRFFKACNSCRVDYLATHIYSCDAQHVMSVMHDLYQRYNRKIWLTEFACPYSDDPDTELQFMKDILPLLEDADYIYRYAWFVARYHDRSSFITSAVNLLEMNSTQLTPLGRYYNNFQGTTATAVVG